VTGTNRPSTSTERQAGARATRPPSKSPLGWLVPLILLLLLAIVVGVTLLLLNANDKGDDPGVDVTDDPQASQLYDASLAGRAA